jgi:hypothetical protein
MKLKEALFAKIKTEEQLAYQVSTWGIYGQSTLIVFYRHFELNATALNQLIAYKALADKLVLALPQGEKKENLFVLANLQVVDGLVQYPDASALAHACAAARLAFENVSTSRLSAEAKERVITL